MSQVITFYSYKGGVGRTMSLVNIAVLLSSWGKRVLIVDWDLEAPGLEHFYSSFFDVDLIKERLGVVDLLDGNLSSNWQDSVIPIQINDSKEPIHFISAGKRDEEYFAKVQNFNVESFYEQGGGAFIEQLREEWKSKYDFVLIDSRTGVTEIGGICTVQLPDLVVLLFTATQQGFSGTLDIALRASKAQQRLPYDRQKLIFMPVLTKFDTQTEFKLSQEWLTKFSDELEFIYRDWLPKNIKPRVFLEATKIPYVSYFSFGEKLPVLEQSAADTAGLTYAYENLAALIANQLNEVNALLVSRERYVSGFNVPETPAVLTGKKVRVFISYSAQDKGLKDLLMTYLSVYRLKYNVEFWSADQLPFGAILSEEINTHLEKSDIFIALVSNSYIDSPWAQLEVDRAIAAKKNILPILLSDSPWSVSKLSRYQFFPKSMVPLSNQEHLDDILYELGEHLEQVIKDIEQKPKVEICIITSFAEDLAVVMDYFEANKSLREVFDSRNRQQYFLGKLKDKGGADVDVSCSLLLYNGSQKFSNLYTALENEFSPQFIIMLTRSASMEGLLTIGDVAVANKLIDFSRVQSDSYQVKRYEQVTIGVRVMEMVSALQIANRSSVPILKSFDGESDFKVRMGPLAISDSVQIIAASTLEKDNVLGISSGFSVKDLNSVRQLTGKSEFILVTQVVDMIDVKKDEPKRSPSNAMQVIAELIKSTYIY